MDNSEIEKFSPLTSKDSISERSLSRKRSYRQPHRIRRLILSLAWHWHVRIGFSGWAGGAGPRGPGAGDGVMFEPGTLRAFCCKKEDVHRGRIKRDSHHQTVHQRGQHSYRMIHLSPRKGTSPSLRFVEVTFGDCRSGRSEKSFWTQVV